MKRTSTLLLLPLFLIAVKGKAQITINSSNVVSTGDVVLQANDTMYAASYGGTGNQTWDYSALTAHDTVEMEFQSPSGTPYASDFPGANMCGIQKEDGDTTYIYFNKSSSALKMDGVAGTNIPFVIDYDPDQTIISFPADHGIHHLSYYGYDLYFAGSDVGAPVDSIHAKQDVNKYDSLTAYGTLTTPTGTFDVLRVKTREFIIDSTWVKSSGFWTFYEESRDTTITYEFWSDSSYAKFPIATINLDSTNSSVESIDWLFHTSPANIAKNDQENSSYFIFPNPADEQLQVESYGSSDAASVELYDMKGKKVEESDFTTGKSTLNINSLAPGLYLLNIQDSRGKVIQRERITVQ